MIQLTWTPPLEGCPGESTSLILGPFFLLWHFDKCWFQLYVEKYSAIPITRSPVPEDRACRTAERLLKPLLPET